VIDFIQITGLDCPAEQLRKPGACLLPSGHRSVKLGNLALGGWLLRPDHLCKLEEQSVMGLFRIFLFILKAVVAQNWWCGQGALQLGHMSDDSLVIVEAYNQQTISLIQLTYMAACLYAGASPDQSS